MTNKTELIDGVVYMTADVPLDDQSLQRMLLELNRQGRTAIELELAIVYGLPRKGGHYRTVLRSGKRGIYLQWVGERNGK